MPDPFEFVYPLPEVSPFEDILAYVPLLLAAVDAELNRDEVWSDDDLDAALGYVQDLKAWLAEFEPVTHPVGMIAPFAGASAPSGWLLCQGQPVSRTAYAALFAVVGTVYGAGDGSTTFNLPDLRGRAAIGAGAGPGLTSRALGAQLGAESHTLGPYELPANVTYMDYNPPSGGSGTRYVATTGSNIVRYISSGAGQAHNSMQPSIAVNFIIRAV